MGGAEARILIPVEYTAFIWAAMFGWLVFAEEAYPGDLCFGTALIVAGMSCSPPDNSAGRMSTMWKPPLSRCRR